MAYGNVYVDGVQSSIAGTPPLFYDGNSTQIGTLCRAWARLYWNGSIVSVASGYNVSSVTRTSAGVYTVNFSTALSDANYAIVTAATTAVNGTTSSAPIGVTAPTASAFQISCAYFANAINNPYDPTYTCVSVFR